MVLFSTCGRISSNFNFFPMLVSIIHVYIFNEIYIVLLIRKGTLRLLSFCRWKEGKFGLVQSLLLGEQERRMEKWERLEVELGCVWGGEAGGGCPQSSQGML